jgi:hypothetical protein
MELEISRKSLDVLLDYTTRYTEVSGVIKAFQYLGRNEIYFYPKEVYDSYSPKDKEICFYTHPSRESKWYPPSIFELESSTSPFQLVLSGAGIYIIRGGFKFPDSFTRENLVQMYSKTKEAHESLMDSYKSFGDISFFTWNNRVTVFVNPNEIL